MAGDHPFHTPFDGWLIERKFWSPQLVQALGYAMNRHDHHGGGSIAGLDGRQVRLIVEYAEAGNSRDRQPTLQCEQNEAVQQTFH